MYVQRPGETKDWQSIKRKAEASFLPFSLMGRPCVFSLCILFSCLSGSGSLLGLVLKPRTLLCILGKREKRWTQVRTSFITIRFKVRPPRYKAPVSQSGLSAALCSQLNTIPQCQPHSHCSRTWRSPSLLCLMFSPDFYAGTLSFSCSSLYSIESSEQVPQVVWK